CPIKPPRQKRFIESVRDGIAVYGSTYDISQVFGLDEIPNLVAFGRNAFDGHDKGRLFKTIDSNVAKEVRTRIKNKHNPRKVRKLVSDFLSTAKETCLEVTRYQLQMNMALGHAFS